MELEEHDGDDSTTYETTATYRYEYDGQRYTGDRVAIESGADNIGDFQRRLYHHLRAAQDSRTAVTAYVDPDDPSRAVLNRELRAGLLALKGVFALVFGGVGFAVLFGPRAIAKKLANEQALRARFPAEPWHWRPEWSNGRIAGSARTAAYVAIAFAVVWNLVSLPAAFVVPAEIASGNTAAAIALLFPLIGLGLAAWAIRAWLQLRRFKVAALTLQRMPVALGGRLKGTIRVEAGGARDGRLRTRARVRRGMRARQRQEPPAGGTAPVAEALARATAPCQIGPTFTTIPVDVAVPAELPATTMEEGPDKIVWRLEVSGECAGPDFWSRFELPVFAGRRVTPLRRAPRRARARSAARWPRAQRTRHRLRAPAARRRSVDVPARPAQTRCHGDQRIRRCVDARIRRALRERCSGPRTHSVLVVRRGVHLVGAIVVAHRVPRDAGSRPAHARAPRLHHACAD